MRDDPFYEIALVRPGDVEPLDLTGQVTRFEYIDREKAADKLTIQVDNWGLEHFEDPVWKKGNLIDVTWGYGETAAPIRRCVIQSVKGARSLEVVALGQEMLMATERRSRTFENVTRAEVVRQIAQENGWRGEALQVQETSTRYETVVQARRTDAEFLRRLALLEGFEFYVDFDGFHFHERLLGAAPLRVFELDESGDVLDFDVENDVTARPGRVRVRGRDPLTGEDIDETADNQTDASRPVLAEILEVIDPETGESIPHETREAATRAAAKEAFRLEQLDAEKERRQRGAAEVPATADTTSPESRVAQEEVRVTAAADTSTAQTEARARFRRATQAAVKMSLDVVGDPGLLAKSVVELRGFGRRLSQRYYVREATHVIEHGSGYETKLKLISDGHGGHSTESRLARGLSGFEVGAAARGRPNTQEPAPGAEGGSEGASPAGAAGQGPPELETIERIDPETGETQIVYRDAQGRTAASRTGLEMMNELEYFREQGGGA